MPRQRALPPDAEVAIAPKMQPLVLRTDGSIKTLSLAFLADLENDWREHGPEALFSATVVGLRARRPDKLTMSTGVDYAVDTVNPKSDRMNTLAFQRRYGRWAVITGASDGIGREFARELFEYLRQLTKQHFATPPPIPYFALIARITSVIYERPIDRKNVRNWIHSRRRPNRR